MQIAIAALLLAAAAQAADWRQLQPLRRSMPVGPQYTWDRWQAVMAKQDVLADPLAEFPGTEAQPASAGEVAVPVQANPRVIGGTQARQGQFPWQAALVIDGSGFCGGSLIGQQWVLTAAHCTTGARSFEVTLGSTSLQGSQSGAVTQVTAARVQHATYSPITLNDDISLIKLNSPVQLTSTVNVVRLPRSSQGGNSFLGSSVIVSGFGRTSSNSGLSPSLLYAQLTVISNTQCAQSFGDIINSAKICTTGANGRSPCNGDSGGPLVVQESDGKYTEVGLVSFGSYGCLSSYPAAFTRITSYLSWISSNSGIAIQP